MTTLRWSSFVEYMKRCCDGPRRTERTFVLLRARGVVGVWCTMRRWWSHPHHVMSKYTTMVPMTALHWSSFFECMGWVLCWPCTNRSYVYISWIWHVPLICSMVVTLLSCAVQKINFNGNAGFTLIFCCLMYGMDAVLALDKQAVRFIFTYILGFDGVTAARLMHYEVAISSSCAILLSKYTTLAIPTLRWSSFVECMEWVSCFSWTNRPYVYCRARTWRCYWRSMQCQLVISPTSCDV